MKTTSLLIGVFAVLLMAGPFFPAVAVAQSSSKSLVINHGGISCGSSSPEDHFFAGTTTANPALIASFNLGLPYYSLLTAYNPADQKVYYAKIESNSTSVYALDFNFGGTLVAPSTTTPTYIYNYQLNQLCFDNNGNNYGFFNFNAGSGTAHLAQVNIATGVEVTGSDRLVQFPAGNIPNTVGDGDIVISPNGRMFATFGNSPSKLFELTNLTGTGNVTAVFLTNIPRKSFSIAFADGNLIVGGSDANGCYYYIWDINSFTLSIEAPFPLSKNTSDMTNLTVAIGSTKALMGVNVINANTATLYYQVVVKNKGNILVNNLQITDNLSTVFGAANISNVHISFSNNPSNLQLNAGYNGTTDTLMLAPSQTLSNYPNAADSVVINLEVTGTNLLPNVIYFNSTVTSGNIGSGGNYLAVSDSSNNGTSARMDLDGNGVSDDAGENTPTPFIFSAILLPVNGFSLQGTKNNNTNHLAWTGITDGVVNRYEVQRSVDPVHFKTTGIVLQQGRARYAFADDVSSITSSDYFYRIKAVTLNGTAAFSNTIVVKNNYHLLLSAYPNPFARVVTIRLDAGTKSAARLVIRDITGRTLVNRPVLIEKGINYLGVSEMHLFSRGLYSLEIAWSGGSSFLKLLKQ